MTREDAFYYKNLLMLGFSDEFNEWYNSFLESEKPLSGIILDLAGADTAETISLLHNYCAEQPFDEAVVCDKIRSFFKESYYSNRMNKEEIVSSMYRLALNIGDPGDFNIDLWGDMYYFEDLHSLAKNGIISFESFDSAFFAYLDNGTNVDLDLLVAKNETNKPSLLKKIKKLFNSKRG